LNPTDNKINFLEVSNEIGQQRSAVLALGSEVHAKLGSLLLTPHHSVTLLTMFINRGDKL
jgi:hypothetical protein